jgi:hypothetical protein
VLTGKDVEVLARQVADLNSSVRALMGGKAAKAPARKTRKRRAGK